MCRFNKLIVALILFGLSMSAYALPTLQVYGVGSTAVDLTADEDTWLVTEQTGSLELIGTYSTNTVSITNAFLVLTTTAGDINPFGVNYAKYDDAAAFEATLAGFDPDLKTNNHSPYGLDASQIDTYAFDLSLLGMGSFGKVGPTKDCNADVSGTTDCVDTPNSLGEIHTFDYDFTGLSLDWVHFDLVAYITDSTGNGKWVSNYWEINPGSHDTTWKSVPETTSLLLLMVGLLGLVGFKRKIS